MEIPDDKLVKNIRNGHTESFKFIVKRYEVQIYNLMYRYSGCREDAADMTQDAFCRVFERLNRYRKQQSFFAWLYTIALNYARDWARKRSTREKAITTFAQESNTSIARPPERIVEHVQETENLVDALKMLPKDRREMVLLKYRHERTIREIAEIFEISESAVKMRLHRALEELGRKLKDNEVKDESF
jgi:RNA polymerase sigma-70 factor (ECF subfamily)